MSEAGTSVAGTTGTGAVAAGAAAVGAPWFGGYDADTQAHITNRGWDKLPVDQAVAQAVKAHREAERLIGIPAEQLLRAPKDANDAENLGKIYSRLGVPGKPEEYDFSGVKFTDGSEFDADATGVRELALKLHLTKDGSIELAKYLTSKIDEADAASAADYSAKLTEEKAQLARDWGQYAAVNQAKARDAFAKVVGHLGLTKEAAEQAMSSMEKSLGFATTMKIFEAFGSKTGEDTFVRNGGNGSGVPTTKEAAQQELAMLEKDEQWLRKFSEGESGAVNKFQALTRVIAGV